MSATAQRKRRTPSKPREQTGPEPVLSLSTAAPVRPTVAIDGTPYEMALMGDFGIVDQQLLSREGAEFQKLWNRDQLNKSQRERLRHLLDHQFGKVLLGIPAQLIARDENDRPADGALNDEDRAQVVLSFMLEPLRKAQAALAETQEQAQPIADWVAGVAERELSADEDAELAALIHKAVQDAKNKT